MMAKEGIAFRQYPVLHELEELHRPVVQDQGLGEKLYTLHSRGNQRQLFICSLSKAQYFSFLMDGRPVHFMSDPN